MFGLSIDNPTGRTLFKQKLVDPARGLEFESLGDLFRGASHAWLLTWDARQIAVETDNGMTMQLDGTSYSVFVIRHVGTSSGASAIWKIPQFEFRSPEESKKAALFAAEALAVGRRVLPGTPAQSAKTRVELEGRVLVSDDFGYTLETETES